MKRLLQPFRRLQWKLTFSYIWITLVTQLVLVVLIFGVVFLFSINTFQNAQLNGVKVQAVQVSTYFLQTPPDTAGLNGWLRQQYTSVAAQSIYNNASLNADPTASSLDAGNFMLVIDQRGVILAAIGAAPSSVGTVASAALSPKIQAILQAALRGQTDPLLLVARDKSEMSVMAVPIMGEHNHVMGALLKRLGAALVNQSSFLSRGLGIAFIFLLFILFLSIPIVLLAAIIGTVFGFLTARSFTQRIKKLFLAADTWSRGDFSASAHDTSSDELGQLAQRLNSMAEQLQHLLLTRQKLASSEERNRLARDLHDSVKQQVFAVSMQLRAAKTLLRSDINEAHEHLNEAEQLVQQTQQELTVLVRELRPIALETKGLLSALRGYITDWSRQTGIRVALHMECDGAISLALDEALFRVTQEALANVARHSEATQVSILLAVQHGSTRLSITDNGCGFDPRSLEHVGVGLCSMRERVEALGGWIEVKSRPTHGTRITVCCERVGVLL